MPPLPPIEVDLEAAGFRISGRLDGIWPSGIVAYRLAKDKGRYQLAAWIDHLILNQSRNEQYPLTTRLITLDRAWVYQPLEEGAEVLERLLHLYWQGLTEPLRFFPESSLIFAERVKKGEKISEALKAAQIVWEGSDFAPGASGEGADPYLSLCFNEAGPFADPFREIALAVLDATHGTSGEGAMNLQQTPATFDPYNVPLSGWNLVEASAGTGKTYALAGLYVRLLVEKGLSTKEILVVTFTKAATDELKGRIRTRIKDTLGAFTYGPGTDEFLAGLVSRTEGSRAGQALPDGCFTDFR